MNQARNTTLGARLSRMLAPATASKPRRAKRGALPAAATPANTLSANVSAANATCIGSNSGGFRASVRMDEI